MVKDLGIQSEIDWRTGDKILNTEGKQNMLEGEETFKQSLFNIGNTQKREDLLDQNVGLDRMEVQENPHDLDQILLYEVKIKEAYNSTVDDRIYAIENLSIYLDKEERELVADVAISNINGRQTNIKTLVPL